MFHGQDDSNLTREHGGERNDDWYEKSKVRYERQEWREGCEEGGEEIWGKETKREENTQLDFSMSILLRLTRFSLITSSSSLIPFCYKKNPKFSVFNSKALNVDVCFSRFFTFLIFGVWRSFIFSLPLLFRFNSSHRLIFISSYRFMAILLCSMQLSRISSFSCRSI